MTLAIRTITAPESLTAAVQGQVREIDRDQPVTNVITMAETLSRSIWQPRLYTILFGVFASVALILASIGIYGVMSYSVTQRTHEVGIRMALGARPRDVLKMIVRQGMSLTAVGIGVGLIGAFLLTRLMSGLLYGVSATDPLTFILISLTLAGVALVACAVPARRATRVDPMIALRYE
jgi:putative ABC transport system permease protein